MADANTALERALRLLGSLESRIMRAVWSGRVPPVFVVRDVHGHMPELAYTTVMTTLNRLADKGILTVERVQFQPAHTYRTTGNPEEFLARASREVIEDVVERFGDAAVAAFVERVDRLPPDQLERLRELGRG